MSKIIPVRIMNVNITKIKQNLEKYLYLRTYMVSSMTSSIGK